MHYPDLKRSSGFSLIELMIAMVIGLILTVGMVSIFSSNKRSSELNQAIAGIQENARLALELMSRDVRMAGFQGCAPISSASVQIHAVDAPMNNFSMGLRNTFVWGSSVTLPNNWTPVPEWGVDFELPTENPAVANTNALMLQFGASDTYPLFRVVGGDRANAAGPIEVVADDTFNIEVGDLAIISDCLDGELFEVTSVSDLKGDGSVMELGHDAGRNTTGALSTAYGSTAVLREQTQVMRFNARIYYVGDTGLVNDNDEPINALYEQSYPFDADSNPPVELVQGVEHLAISFITEDASGRRTEVDAGSALTPDTVRAVRIGLLMSTINEITDQDDDTIYTVANTEIGAPHSGAAVTHTGDRRFRLAFNTTVSIRNIRQQ